MFWLDICHVYNFAVREMCLEEGGGLYLVWFLWLVGLGRGAVGFFLLFFFNLFDNTGTSKHNLKLEFLARQTKGLCLETEQAIAEGITCDFKPSVEMSKYT